MFKTPKIENISTEIKEKLQNKIDHKTKPLGALGLLENIALQVGCIQNTLSPEIKNPTIIVFAGDHGITKSHKVSLFPQEVTGQMVQNFLNGGAGINVFCKENNIYLQIVDAGVNGTFEKNTPLIHKKIAHGTKDYTHEKAMSLQQCEKALNEGMKIVSDIHKKGCNTIGFGEMGIGNTSSASLLMNAFLPEIPLKDCVGKGTGLCEKGLRKKLEILQIAKEFHQNNLAKSPHKTLETLATYGGFETVMLCGAMLQAAHLKLTILIDGFIVSSALLGAFSFHSNVLDGCIFTHCSDEQGHQKILSFFKAKPLLNLGLRLGEGTGVALALPLVKNAVTFLNHMASFQKAKVSVSS